jgi:hypothetical protein
MPIPDNVTFGPDERGQPFSYGQVRQLSPDDQIVALKRRLDGFLIDQVDAFAEDENAERRGWSPFPLAVMTCVAIESLGHIMYRQLLDNKEESKKEPFLAVAYGIDKRLSRQLPKNFKEAFATRWERDAKKYKDSAHLIYVFFRNTMMHGYIGQGVYLNHQIESLEIGDGFLVINPYWFWRAFKRRYEDLFEEVRTGDRTNNPGRKSCLEYLNEKLN